jgi:hypothetical protein
VIDLEKNRLIEIKERLIKNLEKDEIEMEEIEKELMKEGESIIDFASSIKTKEKISEFDKEFLMESLFETFPLISDFLANLRVFRDR